MFDKKIPKQSSDLCFLKKVIDYRKYIRFKKCLLGKEGNKKIFIFMKLIFDRNPLKHDWKENKAGGNITQINDGENN